MKILTFLALLFIVLISVPDFTAAAAKKGNARLADSLMISRRLTKIEDNLNDKNYIRIPKEDFDNIISSKIEDKVNGKFYFWLGIISIVIGIAGASLYASLRSTITNQIDQKINETSDKLKDYINEVMKNKIQDINVFMADAKHTIFSDELEKLQKRITANVNHSPVEYDKIEEKLIALLKRTEDSGEAEISTIIIDELVRCYYIDGKYDEISKIIQTYQEKFDLTVTTLANAAIAYTNFYELDGTDLYKEMSLKYCQEAFKKNPVYGEPTSMELIIHMIDYSRATTDADKQIAMSNAEKLIDKVNSGSSYYWSNDTSRRLEIDKKISFDKYINTLYNLFPEKMNLMKTRSDDYESKKHR